MKRVTTLHTEVENSKGIYQNEIFHRYFRTLLLLFIFIQSARSQIITNPYPNVCSSSIYGSFCEPEQSAYGCNQSCAFSYDGSCDNLRVPINVFWGNNVTQYSFQSVLNGVNALYQREGMKIEFFVCQTDELSDDLSDYCQSRSTCEIPSCDCPNDFTDDLSQAVNWANSYSTIALSFLIISNPTVYEIADPTALACGDQCFMFNPNGFGSYPSMGSIGILDYQNSPNIFLMAHELGHMLGLQHTFDQCYFRENNSPCFSQDAISDTPPDIFDPNTSTGILTNFMSYSEAQSNSVTPILNTNLDYISKCQISKMYDVLYECRNDLCPPAEMPVISPNPVQTFSVCDNLPIYCASTSQDPKRINNCDDNIKWDISNANGYITTYTGNCLNLNSINEIFRQAGTYNVCVYEQGIYNSTCISEINCFQFEIIDQNCNSSCDIEIISAEIICLLGRNYLATICFSGDPNSLYDIFDNYSGTPASDNHPNQPPGCYSFGPINFDLVNYKITIEDDGNPSCTDFIRTDINQNECGSCLDRNRVEGCLGGFDFLCNTDGTFDFFACYTNIQDGLTPLQLCLHEYTPGAYDYGPIIASTDYISGQDCYSFESIPQGEVLTIVAKLYDPNFPVCGDDEVANTEEVVQNIQGPSNCDGNNSAPTCDSAIDFNFTQNGNIITINWTDPNNANDYEICYGDNINNLNCALTTSQSFDIPRSDFYNCQAYLYFSIFIKCEDNLAVESIVQQIDLEGIADCTLACGITDVRIGVIDCTDNAVSVTISVNDNNHIYSGEAGCGMSSTAGVTTPSGDIIITGICYRVVDGLICIDVTDETANCTQTICVPENCQCELGGLVNAEATCCDDGGYRVTISNLPSNGPYTVYDNLGNIFGAVYGSVTLPLNACYDVLDEPRFDIVRNDNPDCNYDFEFNDFVVPTDCSEICDREPFSFPQSITIDCSQDPFNLNVTGIAATACPTCDPPASTITDNLTGCNGTGTVVREWTYTDECNIAHSFTQTITVSDNASPTFNIPPTVTLECGQDYEDETLTGGLTNINETCGGTFDVEVSYEVNLDGCLGSGTVIKTFTVTDNCDNESTANQIIFFPEADNDFVIPQNIAIQCGDDINDLEITGDVMFVSDDCGANPQAFFNDISNTLQGTDICKDQGVITRQWTVVNDCGVIAVQNQIITILPDTDPPVITPPTNIQINCNKISDTVSPAAIIDSLLAEVIAIDNCDHDPVINHDFSSAALDICAAAPYDIVITWTAFDDCDNQAIQQTTTISIIPDTEDPVITPPAPLSLSCEEISATTDPALLIKEFCEGATATDDCDPEILITHDFDGSILDICEAGTITINFTATDNCGNTHTLPSTITIENDGVPPTFLTVASNLDLDCNDINETTALTIEGWLNSVTIEDDCDANPLLTHDYTTESLDLCDGTGTSIEVTWTATDACGNSDTRSAIVTVTPDVSPPSFITEPIDLNLDCTTIGETTAVLIEGWLNSVTIEDMCDNDPVLSHDFLTNGLDLCDPNGTSILVTWTGVDACDNSDTRTATLTVTPDITAPDLTVPDPLTITCAEISDTDDPSALVSAFLTSASAIDMCDTDPVIVHDYDGTAVDICTAQLITVTFTATDACGTEVMKESTIEIIPDVTAPDIPVGGILGAGTDYYTCEADVVISLPVPTDACGVTDYSFSVVNPDGSSDGPFDLAAVDNLGGGNRVYEFEEGESTLLYYAEDACGNLAIERVTVFVIDDLDPYFTDCQSTIVVASDPDQCTAFVNWDVPIAFDNCDTPDGLGGAQDEITVSPDPTNPYSSGDAIPVGGPYTIVYTATDDDGNSATCSFDIVVNDTECPDFITTLPEDMTVDCDKVPEPFEVIPAWHTADNCTASEDIIVDFLEVRTDGSCPFDYLLKRTWTITDEAGNSCSHNHKITVIDTIPPVLIIPEDTRIESCPVAFDTIQVPKVIVLDTVEQLVAIGDDWVITQVVVKKDTFDLVVTPIFIDPTDGFTPVVSDNCSEEANITVTITEETEFVCKGIKAAIVWRIYEAEDECGNITIDTQRIEVLDPNPPVLTVFDTVSVSLGADGHVDLQKDDVVLTVFDACFGDDAEINVAISPNYFNCSDIGQHTILVAATDPCNNLTAYEEVVVNIIDDKAPVLNCPSGILNLSINPNNCEGAFGQILDILDGNDCDVNLTTNPPLDASIDLTTTEIEVIASDALGNTSSCVVDVAITLTQAIDFDEVLACNDRVNISLNGECWLELDPDQILEGDPDLCKDLLCLEVSDRAGDDHLNFFDESDVGEVFTVKVVDCNGSGNSCWAEVKLEEKQIPLIAWPADTSLLCVEPTYPSYFKLQSPQILNCEPVITIEYEDEYIEYDRCHNPRATITRKWLVTDDEGNSAIDTQYIDILPFSTEHVLFPSDITIENPIDCKVVTESIDDIENNILTSESHLHPDSTGLPSLFEIPLLSNSGLCLVSVGYDDQVLELCGGSFSILRKWQVLDLCSPRSETNPLEHTQIITVFDEEGPELDDEDIPGDQVYSYNPWSCAYSGPLPVPGMTDVCGGVFFEAYVTGGGYLDVEGSLTTNDLELTAIGFEEGEHWITYVYTDECDNISLYKFVVTVIDEVEPVAICQNGISVTVTADGVAKIYASDIDGGSHDAGCGPVRTCIVRMLDVEAVYLGQINGQSAYVAANGCHIDGEYRDTSFTKGGEIEEILTFPYVLCKDELKICCADVGEQRIVLQATDDQGLTSVCMATITVVDKSTASLVCAPHDIDCTDDKDINLLAPAEANSICGDELPLEFFDENEFIDGCGIGEIFRVWYLDVDGNGALDDAEVSCNQVITVSQSTNFDPYSLKWPKHYTGEIFTGVNLECNDDDEFIVFEADGISMGDVFTCSATDPGDAPVWCQTSCGLVGLSSEIDTVTAGDACLKLIKRWTVIDWCYWEANGSSPGDDANDTDNDSFEAVEDWAQGLCSGCAENQADTVYFRYTDVDIDGYYTYDQVIKVVDDTAPKVLTEDLVVNTSGGATTKDDNASCIGIGAVTATASDLCGNEAISGELLSWVISYDNGTETSISVADGPELTMETQAGSPGDVHTITFEVTDGCGNRSSAISTITFGDEKKPVPLCIAGVTTAFMESTGSVAVWAKDFDLGSFDNCTDVDFTIAHSGEPQDSAKASIVFDCDDLTQFYELDVWVSDSDGNADFCTVGILIGGSCDGETGAGALIAGSVSTEDREMIEQTQMTLLAPGLTEYPVSMTTTALGEYAFANNPVGFEYDISALKDGDYLNGVTTADLIAILAHTSGDKILDSPYKVIAADVNNDQQVSALDIIVLRNVILGLSRRFSNNTSWRFVDESQEFVNILNPWPFTERINFSTLDTDQRNENFIGVKIGDVNSTVVANSAIAAQTRSLGQNSFVILDAVYSKGEELRVDVKSAQSKDLIGFQFTLEHQGLLFQSIESGLIDITNQNIGIHQDALTASWESTESISSNEVLFTLIFEATESGRLSDNVNLTSSITKAEIYEALSGDLAAEMSELNLDIIDVTTSQMRLDQNDPNPFDESTTISFSLVKTEMAEFSIYNSSGMMVYQVKDIFDKGINSIKIDETIIDDVGIYFYSLKTADESLTMKMVYLK